MMERYTQDKNTGSEFVSFTRDATRMECVERWTKKAEDAIKSFDEACKKNSEKR